MRGLPVLGLSLVLVLSAVPALAEDDHASGKGRASDEHENRTGEHGPTAIGAFAPASGSDPTLVGSFVTFSYSNAGVQAFTVSGTRVFDISVSPAGPASGRIQVETDGAQVQVRTSAYILQVHDNPEAVTRIDAPNGRVTLTLASGGAASAVGDQGATFTLGALKGRATGNDLNVTGNTLSAQGRLLVFVDAPRGDFDKDRGDIGAAITKGHVGAEGSFNKNGSSVKEDVVSYGNVTMRTVRAEHGNITVQVEGHGTDGRVLVLDIDRGLMGADHAGKLHITLDNETVAEDSDLQDLLDPNADGIHAVYHVVFDPTSDAFQVLVRVPHYSVHTLSVSALEVVTPSVVIGVVAGVALLVPSAILLFRRKSE